MRITGRNHLSADRATAWAAFHDTGVLERSLPGAQSVREVEPGRYAMTVSAGVAAIRGTYDGHAAFSKEQELESFVLTLAGSGGPGTVDADVLVCLSPGEGGGTDLDWTADAVVGGAVGGVGQRMLSSVARRLADQFFTNIERDLAASGAPEGADGGAAPSSGGGSADGAAGMTSPGAPGAGAPPDGSAGTASGPPVRANAASAAASGQVLPMLAGAAVALAGVVLGSRLRPR